MNGFGWALKEMQDGQKVRRAGWFPGDFLVLMVGMKLASFNDSTHTQRVNDRTAKFIGKDTPLDVQPYFAAFAGHDKTWHPGFVFRTLDLLALDWEIAT